MANHPTCKYQGGGRVVRWCWVNFQCRGRPTNLTTVGQGPIALTVGAVWTFLLSSILSLLSPSFWETARHRLKYCLKGPLSPKQPTNHVNIKTETTFAGQISDGDLMNYRSCVVNSSHQQ